MFNTASIAALAESFRGELITATDSRYEQACKLYNAMIDKRPRLIARCGDVSDVIAAVNFGRDHDLLVAVRGGGHNGAGLGSCDGGIVIDLGHAQGHPRRPFVAHDSRRSRLHARRRGPCRACIRPRSSCGHRLDDGHRRSHARRRQRLPEPHVRAHDRQPAGSRRRARRRSARHGERARERGSVLGAARRRRQFRRRDELPVSRASRRECLRRARSSGRSSTPRRSCARTASSCARRRRSSARFSD